MKKKFLFLGLMLISLTGCWLGVDRGQLRPIYYISNHSNEDVCLIYTLQPSIVEQGVKPNDTIEIKANDTIVLDFWNPYVIETEKNCKPNSMFNSMKFTTKSGIVIRELDKINNDDWISYSIKGMSFAFGWLYEFKKE